MENISPGLLKKIQDDFAEACKNDKKISAIIKKVRDGTADLNDSFEYSSLIGKILGQALGSNVTFDVLPNNTLFWNIAQDVIRPMLEQNGDLVNIMAEDCQKIVYSRAKVGIKVKAPPRDDDKIKGILDNVTGELTSEQLQNHLKVYTRTFTESVHDDFVKEQARRADKAGLSPKVVRTAHNCCDWCRSVAGIYDYSEVEGTGHDVWRRHTNCNCTITFQPRKGSTQIVYDGKSSYDRRKR